MRQGIETTIRTDSENDATFRAALVADPAAAVAERYGMTIPEGASLRVVEEQPDEIILVLPAPSHVQLSEAELAEISSGADTILCGTIYNSRSCDTSRPCY